MKNGLNTSLLFFFENAKNLDRSDDAKRRKKRGWPNGLNKSSFYFNRPLYTNGCGNCNRKFKDYNKQCLQ